MRLMRGIWCARSNRRAFLPTATRVPMLSNRSINRKTNMISRKPDPQRRGCRAHGRSRKIAQAVCLRGPFRDARSGTDDRSRQNTDQHRSLYAPGQQRGDQHQSRNCERGARVAARLPRVTVVAGSATMMPELRKPISAMNSPTPAATAAVKLKRNCRQNQLPDAYEPSE